MYVTILKYHSLYNTDKLSCVRIKFIQWNHIISFLDVVVKNTNFTLTCKDLQRNQTYIWEKLHPRQKKFKTNETLILQNIKYQDAGTYRCNYKMYYWPGSPWHYGINTVIVVQGKYDSCSHSSIFI